MTSRDEMERWHYLRVACLEIIQGSRKLRLHADELQSAELKFLEDLEALVPDAEYVARNMQERLGMRTPRAKP